MKLIYISTKVIKINLKTLMAEATALAPDNADLLL